MAWPRYSQSHPKTSSEKSYLLGLKERESFESEIDNRTLNGEVKQVVRLICDVVPGYDKHTCESSSLNS